MCVELFAVVVAVVGWFCVGGGNTFHFRELVQVSSLFYLGGGLSIFILLIFKGND